MTAQILEGNSLETLKGLQACSVQCVVTSPPYYGLRDYGTAEWEGGDPSCEHNPQKPDGGDRENRTLPLGRGGMFKDVCGKCGAIRKDEQIGLEPTPEAFVEKLVQVFCEVKRVLKDDGTLWLNLGDSYWGGKGKSGYELPEEAEARKAKGETFQTAHNVPGNRDMRPTDGKHPVIKPKDLIGIPWMVAFALRADGWYLRSEIIWHKPNPMPESVTDRPTKAHEQIFLLSKSEKYFYDQEAILEPVTGGTHARVSQNIAKQIGSFRANGGAKTNGTMKAVIRTPKQQPAGSGIKNNDSYNNALVLQVEQRNKRSVWTVTTKPYKEAHFATFPPDLIEPCILAGSKAGDTILDPFNGSGTTGAVAIKHHRHYIGCELNPQYVKLTKRRLSQVQPVLMLEQSLTQREPDRSNVTPKFENFE